MKARSAVDALWGTSSLFPKDGYREFLRQSNYWPLFPVTAQCENRHPWLFFPLPIAILLLSPGSPHSAHHFKSTVALSSIAVLSCNKGTSQVSSDKRKQTQTAMHGILSEHKKTTLTVKIVKHWNRLPREVLEFPFLEVFKTQLDKVPGNLLSLTPLEQKGWTRWSQSFF